MIFIKRLNAYLFPLLLFASILGGGITGYVWGETALKLKPLGDLFIDLILLAIGPLVFFSISSAVSRIGSIKQLGRLFLIMFIVFLGTGLIAAITTLGVVKLFPLKAEGSLAFLPYTLPAELPTANTWANTLGLQHLQSFFPQQHMLALIVFSLLTGLIVTLQRKPQKLVSFLQSGESLMMRFFSLLMYYAPIGFFAYFAVIVSQMGPALIKSYAHLTVVYYVLGICYFLIGFTLYAYLAHKKEGIKTFWRHVFLPMVTAIATCSSAASIPANLEATKKMRVPPEIAETSIPLGSIIHKDGSVMGGMIKIAFLFSVFHLSFSGPTALLSAIGASLLVGTVMGAIPSGGMIGELLILSLYGFPTEALLMIAPISILIDPLATLISVTGNTVSSMMIARFMHGKDWVK